MVTANKPLGTPGLSAGYADAELVRQINKSVRGLALFCASQPGTCDSCGIPISPVAQFCGECTCRECGASVKHGTAVCEACREQTRCLTQRIRQSGDLPRKPPLAPVARDQE
jgi:hypothetical protein